MTGWIATNSSRKNLYHRNFFYWAHVVRLLVWENDLLQFARTSSPFLITEYLPTVFILFISWHFCQSADCFLDSDPQSDVYLHREDNYMALMLFPCNHAFIVLPFTVTCLLCSDSCFGLLTLMKHKSTVELHLSGRSLSGSTIIRIGLALRANIYLL